MIVGVSAGSLLILVVSFLIWREIQNKHALEVQKRDHNHEVEMVESRNRGMALLLAETPEGRNTLRILGVGGYGRQTNTLAIGNGNGPHAGGSGGLDFDVSMNQISNYNMLGV